MNKREREREGEQQSSAELTLPTNNEGEQSAMCLFRFSLLLQTRWALTIVHNGVSWKELCDIWERGSSREPMESTRQNIAARPVAYVCGKEKNGGAGSDDQKIVVKTSVSHSREWRQAFLNQAFFSVWMLLLPTKKDHQTKQNDR